MDEVKLAYSASKYHMVGGIGPDSYAQNSEYQKEIIVSAEDLIQELTIKHLSTTKSLRSTFVIADLGCSIGPNTFLAVSNIIRAVKTKYDGSSTEFHVFFNDLIDNDFNALFKNLPPERGYFAASAPGSFHGRIFPESTIHFAHCSTALHWLSKIPDEVVEDENSSAYNKGRVHYSGAAKEVREAFSAQYRRDMEAFLNAREAEIVDGGLMVLVVLCFPDGVDLSESSIGVTFEILGSCLRDLADEGKVAEEEVDSFNLPFYYPTPSELKAMIEANGSFRIERIAGLGGPMRSKPQAQVITCHLRAIIGGMIEEHFGSGITDDLFQRHLNKISKSPILSDHNYWKENNYFVFLKRENKRQQR